MRYRGVEIRLGQDRVYWACPNGIQVNNRTQDSIRTMIGRVLNGLSPSDCSICEKLMKPTPISPEERCSDDQDIGKDACTGFRIRRR